MHELRSDNYMQITSLVLIYDLIQKITMFYQPTCLAAKVTTKKPIILNFYNYYLYSNYKTPTCI